MQEAYGLFTHRRRWLKSTQRRLLVLSAPFTVRFESAKGDWMFTSIVVGVDPSPTAREALRKAAELAQLTGARLHIVSAYNSGGALQGLAGDPFAAELAAGAAGLEPALRQRTEQLLTDAAGEMKNVPVETHAVAGEASDALIDVAEAVKADLIVVGNRGMRGTKRMLLGSVPNRVAHHATCGVWIVHTA
jgi:nucleotide-binding universal stress UspA family protein